MALLIKILIYGLIGGIAALVGILLSRLFRLQKLSTIFFVIVIVILSSVAEETVIPKVDEWQLKREIDKALTSMSPYKEIKLYHPEFYRRLSMVMMDSYKKNKNMEKAIPSLRNILLPFIQKKVALSSDNTIIDFSNLILEQIQFINTRDSILCYKYITDFKNDDEVIRLLKQNKDLAKKEREVMGIVVETSYLNPQFVPSDKEVDEILRNLFINFYNNYGESAYNDVVSLESEEPYKGDKTKVCQNFIYLYTEVNKFPRNQKILLFRYLFSGF